MTHCCAPTYTEFVFDNQYLTLTDADGREVKVDMVDATVWDM